MRSRLLIPAAAFCLALALAGCSLGASSTGSTAGFSGTKGLIASTLNLFASDANSANGSDICKNVLAPSVRDRLNKIGTCSTIIDNQLKTIDDFTLKIQSIAVTGGSASAHVQVVDTGTKVIQTVTLQHASGGWRLSAI